MAKTCDAVIDRDSKEIRSFVVSDARGNDLSSDVVQVALMANGQHPTDSDWVTCTWSAPTTVDVKFNLPGGFNIASTGPGRYMWYVKIFHTPEQPILEGPNIIVVT